MGLYENLHLNNGEYVPQYAGSPIEQAERTGDELSNRHYANLAQASQLEILAHQMKSSLLPGARENVDKHIRAIDEALAGMTKNGGERSTAPIHAIASQLMGDEGLLKASQRAKEYNEQTKAIDELTAKGHIPLYDKNRRALLANAPADHDIYQTPYASEVEPYKDPNAEMEDIWKTVNPDLIEGMIHQAKGTKESELLGHALGQEDPAMFFETLTHSGIGEGKINALLDGAMSQYRNTGSYKQQIGSLIGKDDSQVKNEFLKKGLMRTFENLKRDYIKTPNSELTEKKPKEGSLISGISLAPGKVISNAVTYDRYGTTQQADPRGPGQLLNYSKPTENGLKPGELAKLDPNYINDLKAAASIYDVKTPEDLDKFARSDKGHALVDRYNKERGDRINYSWVKTLNKKDATEYSDGLQREFGLRQYMDSQGNVINPFDEDGKLSKDFVNLTGGDPSKFEVESLYDAKNHIGTQKGSNENFVEPIGVVALGADGKTHRFIASQKPGGYNVPPEAVNTNVLYAKTNLHPGKEIDIDGVKVKALVGAQVKDLSNDQKSRSSYPLTASIPEIDGGKTKFYDNTEQLAAVLASVGRKLKLN